MIKIAHEAPKSIFSRVQDFTDYDYALVHLFEEDEEYLKQFQQAALKGREIILDNSNSLKDKIIKLFYWGAIILIIGSFWDYIFPINKHIWTSSYVLYSSGLAMIILAMSMWIIDEKKYTNNIKFGLVFGSNAITAYVLHGIVWRLFQFPVINGVGFQKFWMDTGTSIGLPAKFVSFDWAIFYTLVIYFIVYQLYKRKIFIKV